MLTATNGLRALTAADLPTLHQLLDRNPLTNVFVEHRVEVTAMQSRWLGGTILGWFEDGDLVSACHAAANLVPIEATPRAVEEFAAHVLAVGGRASSIVGEQDAVLGLWDRLRPQWGEARSPRPDQPFLAIEHDSLVTPDPRVRRVRIDEFDVLYPASVAMFTEEVGLDPERHNRAGYRARVSQLIAQGWAFAIIEDGRVLFKAEVGAATSRACQVQGVWMDPSLRGQGLAAAAMSAVVRLVRAEIAPAVTLYVNAHNTRARRVYERVGFEQVATFATILL